MLVELLKLYSKWLASVCTKATRKPPETGHHPAEARFPEAYHLFRQSPQVEVYHPQIVILTEVIEKLPRFDEDL